MSNISALSRRCVAATVAMAAVLLFLAGPATHRAGAVGIGTNQSTLVSAVPAAYTPNITDGTVYAITQVGSWTVVGGSFTTVENHGSTATLSRPDVLAYNTSTGAVSTSFAPALDGMVEALQPGPSANTVYVGGAFNTVNGTKSKGFTLLNVATGAIVTGFKPPTLNGIVYTIAPLPTANRVFIGGSFSTASGATRGGLASLNATTGALDSFSTLSFTGHHNYAGAANTADGAVGPRAMAMNPSGTRLMIVGNFTTVGGLTRDQIAMIDVDGANATVDPNWATLKFTAACFNWAFDTYVTDVQWSPDGSYFAVTATGGSGTNSDGSRSLCDSASRWESGAVGTDVAPTWIDYTGQDSLWSVATSGTAIYVGGHERWLNNSNGYDYAGAGAVPRPGIAALDPVNGVPFAWNPGRSPRGAGAYALYVSSAGLAVGSDTDYIGNRRYFHQKIAYFPLSGGAAPASTATSALPSNLYLAGQLPTSANTNVLYRVDAGGPTIGAIDNGPDWMADSSDSDPGAYRNTGSNTASYSPSATMGTTVPASTPSAIFDTERWDPGSNGDGQEMHWSFPVPSGTHVGVRLYFANRYSGTSQVGQRVFDVAVDGSTFLDHFDIVKAAGADQTAVMEEDDVPSSPSSGQITIDFTHEVENPLINGIELINLDKSGSATSTDDLDYRAMSGSQIGATTTVPNTGVAWGSTRGAFMVGNSIFYPSTDGNFYKATFDGKTVGTPAVVDPYDDPAWDSVQTGSGQTYQSVKPNYYSEVSSITGEFYSSGKLYYSVLGDPSLHWRYFTPDSGIVGSDENTVSGGNFSNIAGMVLSNNTLYYADRSTGYLHSESFAGATPDPSTDTIVSGPSDGLDWRTRGMFLYGSPTFPNQLPTASASSTCTGLSCSFDGSKSNDPDGTVASYAWNFGDGTTGTGQTPSHSYAATGNYQVTLQVTDNRGGQSSPWNGTVQVTAPASGNVGFVGKANYNGASANPSVTVPGGVSAGDTELLFATVNTAGVTGSSPTGSTGWTQIGRQTSSPLETTVFRRTAPAGDSGTTVTVPLTSSSRVDLSLEVYTNVGSATAPFATSGDSNATSHTTPATSISTPGAWVLSYWSIRTSSATTWTTPAGVTVRNTGPGTASAHVDTVTGDSGGPVASGTYPAQTATSSSAGGKGDMVTIVLAPGA